jgi:signal transduction histidine kinase
MRASVFKQEQPLRLSGDGLAAWIRSIGIAAGVGVAYFLAAELSNGFLITPETVIFWPAAGVSSGALISLWSTARWPVLAGVMVATAAANLLRHFGVAVTAVWVLGNTAEPLIIALLVQHYFGAQFKIDQLYCVLGLFAAAIAGTAVASTWWTLYYWLFASLNEPTATWLHWIVSDLAGIVSVAPLVIGIAAAQRQHPSRREAMESIVALAVLAAMAGFIVSLPKELWETVVPAALVFPILLWLAARRQPVFAAAGAFIVSTTVALTAIYGLGHFGDTDLAIAARVLQTQAIILVVAFGTAVLAALFAERRDSEARLAQSKMMLERERDNKLMNLQAAMASISHELKQPLGAITLNGATAQIFLKHESPDLEELRSVLGDMVDDSHRMSQVLDNLRGLFGKSDLILEPIDVNELASRALYTLRNELKDHSVVTRMELMPSLPFVVGHGGQLQEVITNLILNSVEAMDSVKVDRRMLRVRTATDGERALVVQVEDSGPGIDPKKIADIFNAFVTTKASGTGLGLAICRMIIERHGGQLTAKSDGQSGALFQFVLPIQPGDKASLV